MTLVDLDRHVISPLPSAEGFSSTDASLTPPSRFEWIASNAEGLPPHLTDLYALLLQTILPINPSGCAVLRPLWTEEAMHRSYAMLKLLNHGAARGHPRDHLSAGVERALASSLATAYRTLAIAAETEVLSCSPLIRELMRDLGALFGSYRNILLTTSVDRVRLPGYKRRALVLCASELVINALTHAFSRRNSGRIDVSLRVLGPGRAGLRVADTGGGFRRICRDPQVGIAAGLAGLLEAELTYRRTDAYATVAEVVFPIGDSDAAAAVSGIAPRQPMTAQFPQDAV